MNPLTESISGSPARDGFYFPAEWEAHRATWLSWPHKEESWPGKIHSIYKPYAEFIREIAKGEWVCINVNDSTMENFAREILIQNSVDLSKVHFYHHPTNDAWCRDHGPAFLVNRADGHMKAIVSWKYNAWGNKYPPFDLDIIIPSRISKVLELPVYYPGIIMEGGAVDFNGNGTVLTTTSCLLNPNRNPGLSQSQIESYLVNYYGVSQVLWLGDGIMGDDTDGHVDDITRFVSPEKVITMIEHNRGDENYAPLKDNAELLSKMNLLNGKSLEIVEIPMPSPQFYEGIRLPASYANFYISNQSVIVPVFNDPNDDKALSILSGLFPEREVVGVYSTDIVWGLGSFHCLSQQEPL